MCKVWTMGTVGLWLFGYSVIWVFGYRVHRSFSEGGFGYSELIHFGNAFRLSNPASRFPPPVSQVPSQKRLDKGGCLV